MKQAKKGEAFKKAVEDMELNEAQLEMVAGGNIFEDFAEKTARKIGEKIGQHLV